TVPRADALAAVIDLVQFPSRLCLVVGRRDPVSIVSVSGAHASVATALWLRARMQGHIEERSAHTCPPTPLNFSTNAAIFWNTLCFLLRYCGLSGLILGRTALSSVPFSLAYSRLSEAAM